VSIPIGFEELYMPKTIIPGIVCGIRKSGITSTGIKAQFVLT
jgi:hypothetical protein